ncbi:MAG: hypothetical protein NWF09_02755 [Candidatus Bathyarchaeota archaeon]|nr:hypothetical protein [Candidatus Bathyarchaeota archaeon]
MHRHKHHNALRDNMAPRMELHFTTSEQAQKAVALLEKAQLDNSQIAIRDVSFEDRGRRVILKVSASIAKPSEIAAFVFNIAGIVSAARPLTREILIPFSAETRSNT